jgi:DNA repair protein RecO (recombination protein O)
VDQQRIALQPAFVLHARPFRDTSAIVDYLTADHGRIALIARGVRGERSRLRIAVQPLQPLMISWQRRGDIGSLTAAEPASAPFHLHGAWLYSGLYVNELLARLVHRDDPCPGMFDGYRNTLAELAAERPLEPILRRFEKHLLDDMGYGVHAERTFDNHLPIQEDQEYWYLPNVGALARMQPGAIKIAGTLLRTLANGEWNDTSDWPGIKRVHRAILAHYLGDKPLRSRELFAHATG